MTFELISRLCEREPFCPFSLQLKDGGGEIIVNQPGFVVKTASEHIIRIYYLEDQYHEVNLRQVSDFQVRKRKAKIRNWLWVTLRENWIDVLGFCATSLGLIVACVGLWFTKKAVIAADDSLKTVNDQLRAMQATNNITIISDLNHEDKDENAEELVDGKLGFIWTFVDESNVPTSQYAERLLGQITNNDVIKKSKTPEVLYQNIYDDTAFSEEKNASTDELRKIFMHAQDILYEVDEAFDYTTQHVLAADDFKQWKGLLREMHANPLFLTAIWHGYKNHYFETGFAQVLQQELCAEPDSPFAADVADKNQYERDREFIKQFYPEMFDPNWPYANGLPGTRINLDDVYDDKDAKSTNKVVS